MSSQQTRAQRARNGSRRKRDLAAAGMTLTRQSERLAESNAVVERRRAEREARLRPQITEAAETGDAWKAASALLADWVPGSAFDLWLSPFECIGEVDGALALEAPAGVLAWSERRYGRVIGEAIRQASDYRGAFFFTNSEEREEGCL